MTCESQWKKEMEQCQGILGREGAIEENNNKPSRKLWVWYEHPGIGGKRAAGQRIE